MEMEYQVIEFEGLNPIVTRANSREVTVAMQRNGLSVRHKYSTTFFKTKKEADNYARSKEIKTSNGFEEVVSKKVETPAETPIKETEIKETPIKTKKQ